MNKLFQKVFLSAPFFHAENGVIHIDFDARGLFQFSEKAGEWREKIGTGGEENFDCITNTWLGQKYNSHTINFCPVPCNFKF